MQEGRQVGQVGTCREVGRQVGRYKKNTLFFVYLCRKIGRQVHVGRQEGMYVGTCRRQIHVGRQEGRQGGRKAGRIGTCTEVGRQVHVGRQEGRQGRYRQGGRKAGRVGTCREVGTRSEVGRQVDRYMQGARKVVRQIGTFVHVGRQVHVQYSCRWIGRQAHGGRQVGRYMQVGRQLQSNCRFYRSNLISHEIFLITLNLLSSVSRDSILDLILNSLFSILDSRFAQESRTANRVENGDSRRTVNIL